MKSNSLGIFLAWVFFGVACLGFWLFVAGIVGRYLPDWIGAIISIVFLAFTGFWVALSRKEEV